MRDEADMPQADDPPLDSVSMLEVSQESILKARKTEEAVTEYQGRAAVRALIEGVDPVEIARACGFDVDEEVKAPPMGVAMMADFLGNMVEIDMGTGQPLVRKKAGMEQFIDWMQRVVRRIIIEDQK